MYQSVDDTQDAPVPVQNKGINRLKVGAFILIGIALLITVGIYASSSRTPIVEIKDDDIQAKLAYRLALTEQVPALRRSRLADFKKTYPNHDRSPAAEAQLDVLLKADEKDWAALQEVIYDPAQSQPAKLAALELYETIWRPDLLGGRQSDVARLRSEFSDVIPQTEPAEEPKAEPQDFTPPPDKFDTSLNGAEMAGGVVIAENSYIPVAATPNIRPRGNIIAPTVRRNVLPRYPGRAERRGIEAEVILSLNIDHKGEVQMTELVSVRAPKYRKNFIKAAEKAAMRTRFHPQKVNGEPQAASGIVKTYRFKLNN